MDQKRISASNSQIADYCRRHHIRKFALFGSILRGDYRADSDIDVLVEFEPGHVPGLIRLANLEGELSALFGGRKIDIRTPEDLSRYFRGAVMAAAEVRYEQA